MYLLEYSSSTYLKSTTRPCTSMEWIAFSIISDKKLLEAKMVAEKIHSLMEKQLVTDKKTGELRPLRYSDIVILLRSLNGWADSFASVLNDDGIPAHTVSATGYFSAIEVQTVLSMLRIFSSLWSACFRDAFNSESSDRSAWMSCSFCRSCSFAPS